VNWARSIESFAPRASAVPGQRRGRGRDVFLKIQEKYRSAVVVIYYNTPKKCCDRQSKLRLVVVASMKSHLPIQHAIPLSEPSFRPNNIRKRTLFILFSDMLAEDHG
jgi:hypothetical protein